MNGSTLFSFFFVLIFSYGMIASMGYPQLAKLFPFSVSAVGLAMAIINLGEDVRRRHRKIGHDAGMGLSDLEATWEIPHSQVWARAGLFMGSIACLYLGIWVMGYPIAMSIFVIVFYRCIANATMIRSIVAGGMAMGFIALVAKLLNVSWPEGLLSKLIELPWPLG